MTTKTKQTFSAAAYKQLAAKKRNESTVFDVTLPSGAVWKLREPPIQQFIMSGQVPAALLRRMLTAAKTAEDGKTSLASAMGSFTPDDLLSQLEFGRDLLLHCAVEPRLTLDPKGDDELSPSDILPEDFDFLLHWVMNGGNAGSGLETFRAVGK